MTPFEFATKVAEKINKLIDEGYLLVQTRDDGIGEKGDFLAKLSINKSNIGTFVGMLSPKGGYYILCSKGGCETIRVIKDALRGIKIYSAIATKIKLF